MAERAAHLVDHVLPDVPIRQGVLSLPYRLRYLLAWDHDLCRAVASVYVRAILGFLRRRAKDAGVAHGRSGAVAIIQRFGGALNLNVHVHALVMEGVFALDGEGLTFHTARRLTRDDVAAVAAVVARRIERLLQRRGVMATADERGVADAWAEDAPVRARLAAASVQGLVALGPQAGARVARYGNVPEDAAPMTRGPCHATAGGFDLHAGIVVRAGERERLERRCRYTLRPPVADARLRVDADGHVWIALRHPWADGTTHLRGEPVAFLAAGGARPAAAHQPGAGLRRPGALAPRGARASSPRPDQSGRRRRRAWSRSVTRTPIRQDGGGAALCGPSGCGARLGSTYSRARTVGAGSGCSP